MKKRYIIVLKAAKVAVYNFDNINTFLIKLFIPSKGTAKYYFSFIWVINLAFAFLSKPYIFNLFSEKKDPLGKEIHTLFPS